MSAKAERTKNRKIIEKALRRALRNQIKSRERAPTQRRELKVQLAELLARKDGR